MKAKAKPASGSKSLAAKLLTATKYQLVDAAELFLGWQCQACQTPGESVCLECRTQISSFDPLSFELANGLRVYAAASYQYPLDRLIVAHKDRGAWQLKNFLTDLVCSKLNWPASEFVICPVPSTKQAVIERGYDHCSALASQIAKTVGVKSKTLLTRRKLVADQVGLNRQERKRQQIASMQATSIGSNSLKVIIVDDICTTGSTINEANRALSAAGFQVSAAVVIAVAGHN